MRSNDLLFKQTLFLGEITPQIMNAKTGKIILPIAGDVVDQMIEVEKAVVNRSCRKDISITIWNKSGGLWFASNWDGTKTIEQLLGGGNLVVH